MPFPLKNNYVYITNQCVPGAVLYLVKHECDIRHPLNSDSFVYKAIKGLRDASGLRVCTETAEDLCLFQTPISGGSQASVPAAPKYLIPQAFTVTCIHVHIPLQSHT